MQITLLIVYLRYTIKDFMATAKKEEFTTEDRYLSVIAKALSHPARVAILRFLASKDVCYCGEIVEELPLSQSTVSQHLKELRSAGLIKGETEGPKVCYCLDEKALASAYKAIGKLFNQISCC